MLSDLLPMFAALSSAQELKILLVLGILLSVPTLITVFAIWAGAWTKVHKLRLENALKQQMIDRGMSAEEIIAVLNGGGQGEEPIESPVASEVVAHIDDEWQTALVLRHEGDRYFVHVVGTDMSDNQWVTGDQVRFPAGSDGRCGSPPDWSFAGGGVRVNGLLQPAGHSKPAPVDQEI